MAGVEVLAGFAGAQRVVAAVAAVVVVAVNFPVSCLIRTVVAWHPIFHTVF